MIVEIKFLPQLEWQGPYIRSIHPHFPDVGSIDFQKINRFKLDNSGLKNTQLKEADQ